MQGGGGGERPEDGGRGKRKTERGRGEFFCGTLTYANFQEGENRLIGESPRGVGEGVEFVEFAAEDGSVGQAGLVVGDQSGRGGAGEHVFDNPGVFCGAEENADGGRSWGESRLPSSIRSVGGGPRAGGGRR